MTGRNTQENVQQVYCTSVAASRGEFRKKKAALLTNNQEVMHHSDKTERMEGVKQTNALLKPGCRKFRTPYFKWTVWTTWVMISTLRLFKEHWLMEGTSCFSSIPFSSGEFPSVESTSRFLFSPARFLSAQHCFYTNFLLSNLYLVFCLPPARFLSAQDSFFTRGVAILWALLPVWWLFAT